MASMMELINEIWHLERELVSDGFDKALYRLAEEISMQIHEYRSGTQIWTWKVPEKWTCHEAYLETLSGERLIDYADHPLHIVSYSLPFEGEVSRTELFKHLHTHKNESDLIPFVFKYYQRDWGLCCTQELKNTLQDDKYRVVIKTSFEEGELKVGEVVVEGELEDIFVLAAHLCHPHMANDDLTGVVAGLELMKRLAEGPKPKYTYRFLILPETVGSVAYLSSHESLIPQMRGGLFLEMLGNDSKLTLQRSLDANKQIDNTLVAAFKEQVTDGYVGDYRTIICNDERQFNSPGVKVPMLSISRVENPEKIESLYQPYPEYHSSADTPEIVTEERLNQAVNVIYEMIRAVERDLYVVNHFKGEVFASGYGIWIDYRENPEGHRNLFKIMERCDGEHTISGIAEELGITYKAVWDILNSFAEKELISYSPSPRSTDPHKSV